MKIKYSDIKVSDEEHKMLMEKYHSNSQSDLKKTLTVLISEQLFLIEEFQNCKVYSTRLHFLKKIRIVEEEFDIITEILNFDDIENSGSLMSFLIFIVFIFILFNYL